MDIFPVGPLLRELVVALGAALIVGNLAVFVRERRRRPDDQGPRPNWTIVFMNLGVGLVLTIWGLGSLIAAR